MQKREEGRNCSHLKNGNECSTNVFWQNVQNTVYQLLESFILVPSKLFLDPASLHVTSLQMPCQMFPFLLVSWQVHEQNIPSDLESLWDFLLTQHLKDFSSSEGQEEKVVKLLQVKKMKKSMSTTGQTISEALFFSI